MFEQNKVHEIMLKVGDLIQHHNVELQFTYVDCPGEHCIVCSKIHHLAVTYLGANLLLIGQTSKQEYQARKLRERNPQTNTLVGMGYTLTKYLTDRATRFKNDTALRQFYGVRSEALYGFKYIHHIRRQGRNKYQ